MSSSSATATTSRSPSPHTPEVSDCPEPIAIQSDFDLTSGWYHNMDPIKPVQQHWDMDTSYCAPSHKIEEDVMLRLDELLEQHAYDDSPSPPELSSSHGYSSPNSQLSQCSPIPPHVESVQPNFRPSNLLVPSLAGPVSLTKPIPPPASLPRKDPALMNQRVVFPPKESCFNLPIMFPSIPEGGTKSRVETQVRVTVDLADVNSSSDPYKYDRVGSWKWLKLPQGTATKKRTRKQGKIDPDAQDVLHLSATITCASAPHNRVLSCSSCQAREAKRVAKKLAARVRPARTDSDSCEGDPSTRPSKNKQYEDTSSIIQFNCAEVLDFSTGSVVLPLRITCYCRHHREKVGFNVHLTMMDSAGRIVGSGTSRPIMITDDHKTATSNGHRISDMTNGMEPDWAPMSNEAPSTLDARATIRRKKDLSASASKKRPKPYDSAAKPNRASREGSVSSLPSPSTSYSPLPMTRSPTPSSVLQHLLLSELANAPPPLQHPLQRSDASSPVDPSLDVHMPDVAQVDGPQAPSPVCLPPHAASIMPAHPHPVPYMFFDPTQAPQSLSIQLPTIHRLIPNLGPTHGGIEVTVLGANFHPTLQLNCIFGDVVASSTQRWSDNTLVCVLPPRQTAGVVAVWFDGFPKLDDQINAPPSLFTYQDETDRALMELALQVVGLKMTGKIEDAKNVAMRIVGNAGSDGSQSQGGNNGGNMQLASSASTRSIRPLLLAQASGSEDFETIIVDFLSILDTPLDDSVAPHAISTSYAISHASSSGQTLLHLAAFLGYASLLVFLINRDVDLDARDRNGYTALHFAALSRSTDCARLLIEAGADREIVNARGKTAQEIATPDFFYGILPTVDELDSDSESSARDDSEADWGDVEDDDVPVRRILSRRLSHRALRRNINTSGRGTPRRSAEVSRAATPSPLSSIDKVDKAEKSDEKDAEMEKVVDAEKTGLVDAKQTASFIEMIQRTLAQFPAAQGMIPNMPQLPLPHLPHLDLPAVPWGVLPQLPMVFPVFVPMVPGLAAFLGREQAEGVDKTEGDEAAPKTGSGAIRAAQEWRATWEKWLALAVATARQTEDVPPPRYTPRAAEGETTQEVVYGPRENPVITAMNTAARLHMTSEMRAVGYGTPVADEEVDAFKYQPTAKQARKVQKKHDRMLLLFWLPILFLSLLWALHNGVRFAFNVVKMALPLKTPFRT